MKNPIRLLMLGAMYENGGNTTHRFLDGHPSLYVYPFESQVGTRLVQDPLTTMVPQKYRWPAFDLAADAHADYRAIIDEECKVRARTPNVSKFRDWPFDFDDEERLARYKEIVAQTGRSRGDNVAAFFQATFDVWKDFNRSGEECMYVGYSPVLVLDAEKMLHDLPNGHFLHVVRNPWSAYADTKKRPVPLPLASYVQLWALNQYYALQAKALFPDRMHILRLEDELADPHAALGALCEKWGIPTADTLRQVSWNGKVMEQVYPWGTIRTPTPEANRATAAELTKEEQDEVRVRAQPYLNLLGYEDYLA